MIFPIPDAQFRSPSGSVRKRNDKPDDDERKKHPAQNDTENSPELAPAPFQRPYPCDDRSNRHEKGKKTYGLDQYQEVSANAKDKRESGEFVRVIFRPGPVLLFLFFLVLPDLLLNQPKDCSLAERPLAAYAAFSSFIIKKQVLNWLQR